MRACYAVLLVLALLAAGCAQVPKAPERPSPQAEPSPEPAPDTDDPPAVGELVVEVLDVGQGDAIHVHGSNGSMLVDAGNWRQASQQALLDHLAADGIETLEAFVITHPDADHAGTCAQVLEAYPVATVAHPGSSKDTQTWRDCQQAIGEEPATVLTDRQLDPGDELAPTEALTSEILWIDGDSADVNDGSIVLRLSHGQTAAVLAGDISCEIEERVLSLGLPVQAGLLKVAHHGSASSTCQPWLDAVDPHLAAIGVGADNAYGHPHDEVLDRLRVQGTSVYRTDLNGTIAFATKGTEWTVEPEVSRGVGPVPAVEVTTVHADAPGNDHENPNGEWANLTARSNETVELGGFELSDEAGYTYRFPDVQLAPNQTLTVYTGTGTDGENELYWGRDSAVWNNAQDTATLHDAHGRLVDELAYG